MKILFASLLFLSLALPSLAEDMDLKYELYWSGFKVGEMDLAVEEKDNRYSYAALIESKNILRYFTKYWSANYAKGIIKNGDYIPTEYKSTWNRKKDRQTINIAYEENGNVKEVTKTPDDRKKHPEVDDKLKANALDPVTAALFSRSKVAEIMNAKTALPAKFSIPIYDAKRRFDVEYTIRGYKTINVGGKSQELLHVVFKRKPIAGFRANELKRMGEHEPVVEVYLNENFIPVWGFGKAELGTATIKLAEIKK